MSHFFQYIKFGALFLIAFVMTVYFFKPAIAGTLEYEFEEASSEQDKIALHNIQNGGFLDVIQESINQGIELPYSLKLRFAAIEDENVGPYYDGNDREIMIPYHFWDYVHSGINELYENSTAEELNQYTADVVIHTLYHEITHALIDILALPITGKEENVADELGVLFIIDTFENGSEIALTAAEFFAFEGSEIEEFYEEDLFAEHALDDQRFFNVLCLAYGAGENENIEAVMQEIEISEDQLSLCEETFYQRYQAWGTILAPYTSSGIFDPS